MSRNSYQAQPKNDSKAKIRSEKPPTLSYSQLKVELSALREENAELKQKLQKQQNSAYSSKVTVKELQKKNTALTLRLEAEKNQHKELMTAFQGEVASKTAILQTRLKNCEAALEKSGINPVTFAVLEHNQEQKRKMNVTASMKANILKKKLEESISNSYAQITVMKKMQQKCQAMTKVEGDEMEA